jgi:hypothetical protein
MEKISEEERNNRIFIVTSLIREKRTQRIGRRTSRTVRFRPSQIEENGFLKIIHKNVYLN